MLEMSSLKGLGAKVLTLSLSFPALPGHEVSSLTQEMPTLPIPRPPSPALL